MATDQAPINEDDDLFNFDDLNVGSSRAVVVSTPIAPAPASPAAIESPPAPVPSRKPANAQTKAPHVLVAPVNTGTPGTTGTAAPAATSATAFTASAIVDRAPAAPATPAVHPAASQLPLVKPVEPRKFAPQASIAVSLARERSARKRPSIVTISLLGLAVVLNIGLAGIVWRSMSKASSDPKQEVEQAAHVDPPVAHDVPKPPVSSPWKDLEIKPPSSTEGESTLATAADEIHRGEYERARARLYSLLSVIDRFDVALRPNLAARAQVLAADSYREQADAVEQQALASLTSSSLPGETAPKRP